MGFLSKVKNVFTGGDDAKDAAKVQSQATDKSIAFQKDALKQLRGDLQPYKALGDDNINSLQEMVNSSPESIDIGNSEEHFNRLAALSTPDGQRDFLENDAVLSYANDEANRSITASTAATGKSGSGGHAKALQVSAAGLAGDRLNTRRGELGELVDRHGNLLNQKYNDEAVDVGLKTQKTNSLFNLINIGQNSAAQSGAASQQTANQLSTLTTNQGNADAAAEVAGGNNLRKLISSGMQAAALGAGASK